MLALYLYLSTHMLVSRVRHDERGQATAEYALVLLGAAAVALLIVGWATHTNLVGKLLDAIMNNITGKVK
jgi:Flp pilus assembly pilin Flp